jgi:phage terminase large subunit-like protein
MQPFELTPKQQEALALLGSPARHILLYGGSRSGKTFLLVRSVLVRALKASGSRHLITRFRFNHCKASIGLDTLPKVVSKCFPGLEYRPDRTDWYWRLPNQSEIWLGGLDDKERTEKILGQEYATVYLNECSQIPWTSRNIALTRLAQLVEQDMAGQGPLPLRMYYDENPPSKGHWTYRLFRQLQDPDTKRMIADPKAYACMQMNPVDNTANLPADYLKTLSELPQRLQRRFLRGEFGEAAADALWTEEMLDQWRIVDRDLPDLQRIVVAVDPSGADDDENADNDEIGIVVCGLGTDGCGYVLEDLTLKAGPARWGKVVADAYDRHAADKVVAEINFGGAMVQHVIRTARANTPFQKLTASRGKVVRAEPISSLTEHGKVRLAGYFPNLEDELVAFTTHGYMGQGSPNRADAMIWGMSALFPGLVKVDKEPRPDRAQPAITGPQGWLA